MRIRVHLLSILILSTFQAHAQTQVDPFELAQLTCAALVAAVKKTPIPDYLDQSENPNFFVMLRRHEPLYNKCMAACAGPVSVRDCAIRGQPPAVSPACNKSLIAQLRAIGALAGRTDSPLKTRFAPDSPLEGVVSSELVSAQFPVIQGKYREFH